MVMLVVKCGCDELDKKAGDWDWDCLCLTNDWLDG